MREYAVLVHRDLVARRRFPGKRRYGERLPERSEWILNGNRLPVFGLTARASSRLARIQDPAPVSVSALVTRATNESRRPHSIARALVANSMLPVIPDRTP